MELSILILLVILVAAVLGHADSVAVAACLLLIVKLLHIDKFVFPVIKSSGTFWGLVLLIAAILVPAAGGEVKTADLKNVFTSWVGVTALLLSFLTTWLSGLGLRYLTVQQHADVMPALVLGSVASAAFLGGVPVGPLITSGLLAVIARVFSYILSSK